MNVNRNQLPEGDVKVGDMFHGPNGEVVTVTAMSIESVTLDANHPLAGQKLIFDVEIDTVREATKEEVAHGHAHGADGHHQH
jgi:FKBP-type peptidyl-prolyl cis-trans isomerase SlyD